MKILLRRGKLFPLFHVALKGQLPTDLVTRCSPGLKVSSTASEPSPHEELHDVFLGKRLSGGAIDK
jgi:hypothetical protein